MREQATLQRGLVATLLSAALACSIPATHAATPTWNGGGGADRNWTTAANWGGTAPVANDSLVFAGTTGLTPSNNFAANTQFNGLTFNAGAGAFTLSGNATKLGGNIVDNASTAQAVTLILALQQNTDIGVTNSGGSITFNYAISGGFSLTKSGAGLATFKGAGTYTGGTTVNAGFLRSTPNTTENVFGSGNITIASGATLQFRPIGNTVTTANIISGAGTVNAFGGTGGVQILSGANTYTGATTVTGGVLNIQNATALGTTDNGTSVSAGYALQIQNNITVGAESLALNGTGIATDGALRNISGTNVWQGTVTLGSAARINSDSGSLTFNTATNSITGTNQALTLGGAGNGTVGGTITTGTGTLTKDGAGTWTLSGTNTYSGATSVTWGTLQLDGSTAAGSTVGVETSGTLTGSGTVNGNATLTGGGIINKSSGTIVGTLGVTGGNWNGNGSVTGVVTSSNGTFTIGSGANLTANGGMNVTGGTLLAGNATSTITGSLNYTSSRNSTFAGTIAGSGKTLTMNATGTTLTLSGNNSYTGATNVTAGTLLANNTIGSATGSGNVTVATGANLGGNGTIGGATTIAGIISPGDGGIGALNITGNVTWQGASSNGSATDWIFQLGASPTSDLLNITGNFTKDASTYGTNFRFNFEGATNTGTFKVVDWSGTSSFIASDFSYTNLGSGLTGSFSIIDSQLDFSVLPAVPEPSTWVAMAVLIITGGTMAMRRRTRQATGIL